MATTTLTVPPTKKNGAHQKGGTQPCDCGGGGGETCCGLDCLVQPRFFCGQLLTDQDLTALVNWTRDKAALSRFRDGWGVVCGLDVRRAPGSRDRIVVTPGYAVNCCGDDIVVCSEYTLDLSGACRGDEDPCADLRRAAEDKYGALAGYGAGGRAAAALGVEADLASRKSLSDKNAFELPASPGRPRLADEPDDVKVIDIYIRYDEKPSEPATALGRSACREVSACEYSRTRESYEVSWEYGVPDVDPVRARAERWHAGYEECLKVLAEFNKRFGGAAGYSGDETRRFLLDWLDRNPVHYSFNWRDHICALTVQDLAKPQVLAKMLFYMVQDCRRAYLSCACFGCDEDDKGVPLARVQVVKDDAGGCYVYGIDPYPPYRRPLQPECWPAPLGYVNVGRAIWHRWDEVCTTLADLGVRVTRADFRMPASPADLAEALRCDLFVRCGEERVAYTVGDTPNEQRVVGFCTAINTPPPPPPPALPLCPKIRVIGQPEVGVLRDVSFNVEIEGGDPNVTPTFNWALSGGKIISGQGTQHIEARTSELSPGGKLTASVEVGGYDISCETSASFTTTIVRQPPAKNPQAAVAEAAAPPTDAPESADTKKASRKSSKK